jgi:hypothetical protein
MVTYEYELSVPRQDAGVSCSHQPASLEPNVTRTGTNNHRLEMVWKGANS